MKELKKKNILNTKTEHDRTPNKYDHYWKTVQQFYDRAQNRHTSYKN